MNLFISDLKDKNEKNKKIHCLYESKDFIIQGNH